MGGHRDARSPRGGGPSASRKRGGLLLHVVPVLGLELLRPPAARRVDGALDDVARSLVGDGSPRPDPRGRSLRTAPLPPGGAPRSPSRRVLRARPRDGPAELPRVELHPEPRGAPGAPVGWIPARDRGDAGRGRRVPPAPGGCPARLRIPREVHRGAPRPGRAALRRGLPPDAPLARAA